MAFTKLILFFLSFHILSVFSKHNDSLSYRKVKHPFKSNKEAAFNCKNVSSTYPCSAFYPFLISEEPEVKESKSKENDLESTTYKSLIVSPYLNIQSNDKNDTSVSDFNNGVVKPESVIYIYPSSSHNIIYNDSERGSPVSYVKVTSADSGSKLLRTITAVTSTKTKRPDLSKVKFDKKKRTNNEESAESFEPNKSSDPKNVINTIFEHNSNIILIDDSRNVKLVPKPSKKINEVIEENEIKKAVGNKMNVEGLEPHDTTEGENKSNTSNEPVIKKKVSTSTSTIITSSFTEIKQKTENIKENGSLLLDSKMPVFSENTADDRNSLVNSNLGKQLDFTNDKSESLKESGLRSPVETSDPTVASSKIQPELTETRMRYPSNVSVKADHLRRLNIVSA